MPTMGNEGRTLAIGFVAFSESKDSGFRLRVIVVRAPSFESLAEPDALSRPDEVSGVERRTAEK